MQEDPKHEVGDVVALKQTGKDVNEHNVIGHWWSEPHGTYVYNVRHIDGSERIVTENEIA